MEDASFNVVGNTQHMIASSFVNDQWSASSIQVGVVPP